MSKVLYIKADVKPEELSRTFIISDSFIAAYKHSHPEDEVITIDLYKEDIKFLSIDDINTIFGPKNPQSRNHPILKYAYQFAEADKYVFAEPMWNLSIPAILKAYIDYVCVPGVTFRYTENGPIGLCHGKKAINITARGGEYSVGPFTDFEMGDRYLGVIIGFLGISEYKTISADALDVVGINIEDILENAVKDAQEKAVDF